MLPGTRPADRTLAGLGQDRRVLGGGPRRGRRGPGRQVDRDAARVQQVDDPVEPAVVEDPLVRLDPGPGEDADGGDVDAGPAHQPDVLWPDLLRPLLRVVVPAIPDSHTSPPPPSSRPSSVPSSRSRKYTPGFVGFSGVYFLDRLDGRDRLEARPTARPRYRGRRWWRSDLLPQGEPREEVIDAGGPGQRRVPEGLDHAFILDQTGGGAPATHEDHVRPITAAT